MKKNYSIIVSAMIVLAILLSSVATLALIRDTETKIGNIIKFEKVALMGDSENGSRLSIKMKKPNVGFGQDVIGGTEGGESLLIRPAEETEPMFVRFKIYFTLENEKLNKQYEEALTALNKKDENGLLVGLTLKNDAENYKLVPYQDWVYITTNETSQLLKVITEDDKLNGFSICEEYKLNYDITKEHLIFDMQEDNDVFLKVEVNAIQAYGVSNSFDENKTEGILSSGNDNLEEQYGNATILDFIKAIAMNDSNGLPVEPTTFANMSWNQIKTFSNYIELARKTKLQQKNTGLVNGDTFTFGDIKISYKYVNAQTKSFTITNIPLNVSNTISLKDKKTISIPKVNANGTVNYSTNVNVTLIVSDFLHDKIDDNNYAGITLTTLGVYDNLVIAHRPSNYTVNNGGYFSQYDLVNNLLKGKMYEVISEELGKDTIVPVLKGSTQGGGSGSRLDLTATFQALPVWALSVSECMPYSVYSSWRDTVGYSREGNFYPIYEDKTIRIKKTNDGTGTAVNYYTRSCGKNTNGNFMYATSSGGSTDCGTTTTLHIAFGFSL